MNAVKSTTRRKISQKHGRGRNEDKAPRLMRFDCGRYSLAVVTGPIKLIGRGGAPLSAGTRPSDAWKMTGQDSTNCPGVVPRGPGRAAMNNVTREGQRVA